MDAITDTSAQRQKLLDEYRIALRMWSETKALYEIDSAEVSEATNQLDQMLQDLIVSQFRDLQRGKLQPIPAMES